VAIGINDYIHSPLHENSATPAGGKGILSAFPKPGKAFVVMPERFVISRDPGSPVSPLKPHKNTPSVYFRTLLLFLFLTFISYATFGQIAGFSADPLVVCKNDIVTFTDESTDANTWEWDFGEGAEPATAIGEGPHNVKYSTAGLKTVSLTINGSVPQTKIDYVTVNTPPEVSFGYEFQRILTIDHNFVYGEEDLVDFTLLVNIASDPELRSSDNDGNLRNNNGWDLIFTDDQFNRLNHELQEYNPLTGKLIAWVRIPLLKHGENTTIHMLYGNPNISTDPSTSETWNANYSGVWHLSGGTGDPFRDATSNNNDGINSGTSDVSGKIGRARNFHQPGQQYITVPPDPSLELTNNQVTVQAWVNIPSNAPQDAPFIVKGNTMNRERYMLGIQSGSNRINTRITVTPPTLENHFRHDVDVIPRNQWTHITFVYDGTRDSNPRKLVYKNGTLVGEHDADGIIHHDPTDGIFIGRRITGDDRFFHGILDEIRVSKVRKSEGRIRTEYSNQNGSDPFYTIGNEEDLVQLESVGFCNLPVILDQGYPAGGVYEGEGVSLNGTDYEFEPSSPGTYILIYRYTDANGCAKSVPKDIKVTTIPVPPVAGNLLSCYRNVDNLEATGTNLRWYDDSGLTNLVHTGNPFLTGNTGLGAYTYYVTQSINGCESNATPVTLTIIEPIVPTITMPATDAEVCAGDEVTFSIVALDALTYRWQRNGVDLFNDQNLNGVDSPTLRITRAGLFDAGEYRCVVTGICDAENFSAATLTVKPAPVATFGYEWEKSLTINSDQIEGTTDLIDFPLLVNITDEALRHTSNGGYIEHLGGYDIVFTRDDYTPLSHELEHYDPVTGEYVAWVRIPVLSAETDTEIKILYGNRSVSANPSSPDTWSEDYVGVWHLHGNKYRDATLKWDGRSFGVNNINAVIAEGGDFGHSNFDRIDPGGIDVDGSAMTITAWINARSIKDARFISKATDTDNNAHLWKLGIEPSGHLRFRLRTGGITTALVAPDPINTYTDYYMSGVYDGNNMLLFQNGVQVAYIDKTGVINTDPGINVGIGNQPAGAGDWRVFDGILDEIRIIKAARSAEWLTTEYNNQLNPASFVLVDPDQNPNPWHIFEVCAGETAVYQTRTITGAAYLWEVTGGTIAGDDDASSVEVNWTGGVEPSIKLSVTLDGCSTVITFPVTIHSLPIPEIDGPAAVCSEAANVIYEVENILGHSYLWEIEGGTITSGNVTIEVTVDWGTTNPDAWISLTQTTEFGCITKETLEVGVLPQPVAPGITKDLDIEAVCIDEEVSATFTAGSGGVNSEDIYEYSINSGFSWNEYSPAQLISSSSPGASQIRIRAQRISDGPGCIDSEWENVSWTVEDYPDPPVGVNVTVTYDGQEHTAGATVPGGYNIIWYDAETGGNIITQPTGTNAGTYSAWAETENPTGCRSTSRTEVTLTITAKILTITPDPGQSKVYGQPDPAFTFQASGFEGSDDLSLIAGQLAREPGEDAGSYDILIGTLSAGGNYSIVLQPETFHITLKTLVITPDPGQSKVYGQPDPAFTFQASGFEGSDDLSLITGQLAREPGEDAGTYDILIGTLSAGGNYSIVLQPETFEITLKTLVITPDPGQSKVYGQPDPAFTFQASGFEGSDDLSLITGQLAREPGEDAGTYDILIGTLSAGGNYSIVLQPETFHITLKTLVITPDPGQSKVYGQPDPVFTYQASGFEGSDDLSLITGQLAREPGEDAGNYDILIGTLSAGGNYSIVLQPETFAITLKTLVITPDPGQSKVYGQPDPAFTFQASGFEGSDDLSLITGQLAREPGEDAGTYDILIGTLSAGGNYSIVLQPETFHITLKTLVITPDPGQSKVYGQPDPVFTYQASGFEGSDDLSLITGQLAREPGEDAGTYDILIGTLSAGGNYSIVLQPETFEITLKTLVITPDPGQSKVYGQPDPAFTFQSSGFEGSDDLSLITGQLAREPGEDAGTYDILIGTLSAGGNYSIVLQPETFEITLKTLVITPDPGQSKVYGQPDPAFTFQASGFEGSDDLSLIAGQLAREPGEDAGTYDILIGTLSAGGNYSIVLQPETFEITLKTLVITPDPGQSKVYGQPDPAFTFQASGFEGSDDLSLITGQLAREPGEDAGTYDILIGTLSAGGNYSIVLQPETFHITLKTLVITPDPGQSKVYGQPDPAFTFQASGFEGSDDLSLITGQLAREPGEDAGNYDILIGTLSAGGNYSIVLQPETFAITLKTLVITPDPGQSKVYGQPDPVFTYQASGFEGSDDLSLITGQLAREPGEDAGTYDILIGTLSAGGNYSIVLQPETFEITLKTLVITPDPGQSKVYGQPDPAFTFQASGFEGSDDLSLITGQLAREPGEDAGTYDILIGTLSAGGNYSIVLQPETFEITKRSITITVDPGQSKNCGQQDPLPFTFEITDGSLIFDDEIDGHLDREPGELSGVYEIRIGSLTIIAGSINKENNYELIFVPAFFTINPNQENINVIPVETNLCFDENAEFTITLEDGFLLDGAFRKYQVEITYPINVEGAYRQGSSDEQETVIVSDLVSLSFTDIGLINNNETVQTVIYIFNPYIELPDAAGFCISENSVTIVIEINPRPIAIATPTEQTICDGATTDIQLTTPTTASHGVRFEYSIFNQDPNLNLLSGGTGLLEPGQGIQEQFENTSDEFGQVTFIITPRTIDADENLTCTGQPIYVTITVEPAPVVIATPTEQTICDGATTDIQLTTPTTASHGVRFEYSIFNQDPNLNLLSGGTGLLEPGQGIQEQFENTSDEFGQVTFIITPRTIDADENLTCTGQPIYVTITVEPAPVVIATPTEQTICDGATTDIQLTTPTTASHGVRFEYSIFNQDANLNLLSGGTGLLEPGQGIQEQFENTSDQFGQVTFIITPRTIDADENLTCTGQPIYVTITVEPTPKVIATPEEQTICDGATTDIQLTTPTTASHGVRFEYSISAQDPNITLLSTGEGVLEPGQRIQEQFENTSDQFGQVTFIITPRTIDADENLTCTGQPIYVTITVEPAPKVIATPEEQTICDGATTDIQLTTPTTASHGVRFEYSIFNQDANLNLLSGGAGLLEPGQGIQEQFENTSDQFGQVTFIITPRTIDADENLTCTGQPIYVTITVEPTPKVIATPEEQTICDGATTDIQLTTPTTASQGVRFEYLIFNQDANLNLLSGGAGLLEPGQGIQEQFENTSDQFGQATFIITPRTIDADENLTCTGQPIYVTITVEPTPKVIATPEEQTICDGGTTDIVLTTPTTASHGVRFEYSIFNQDPNLNLLSGGTGLLEPGQGIQEQFENTSDEFGQVTFIITPRTIDADENLTCTGQPIYVTITVEPTPKVIATPEEQTICDGGTTDIVLTTPTTASHGVRFEYSIFNQDPNLNLLSGGTGLLEPGQGIQEQFENTSDQFGQVTFIITPRTIDADENLTCTGQPIYVTITVEPAPVVIATPTEQTICDGATTDIQLTTPTTASHGVRFEYSIFNQDANLNLLSGGTGLLEPGQGIQEQFENTSDQFGQVTFIITPRTIDADENLTCTGQPIYVTITVEPTPKVIATPEEQTICDGATTDIQLTTPTTASHGVRFEYSISAQDPNITLLSTGEGVLEPGQRIQEQFENTSDQFGQVTFIITPRTIDADENLTCTGQPIYVTITVEPAPKVIATPEEQTICDGATTDIQLTTPTTASHGVRFEYSIFNQDANLNLLSGGAGLLEPGQGIQEQFENTSDQFGQVTFIITPRTIDADENLTCTGQPIYVTITVEPTPKVIATPEEQTICDGATTDIQLTTPTTASHGVRFEYSIFNQDANLNLLSGGTGLLEPGQGIQEQFENTSDQFGQVTFIITPRTIDADENLTCTGQPIYVTITVEPTPKVIATPEEQTICDGGTTDIQLITPTNASQGVRFEYSISAQDPNITLLSTGEGVLEPGQRIQEQFENTSDQFGQVTFIITPRTIDADENLICTGQPIYVTITVEPAPVVIATPTEQTICDGGTTDIILTTPTTASHGVRFEYSIFNQDPNLNLLSGGTGLLEPGQGIQEQFENTSDEFGQVTFIITPRTIDADENLTCTGQPIYVTITVEPAPVVIATPTEQTICDGATTDIVLTTPTTASHGVRFEYSIFNQDPNLNLLSGGTGLLEPGQGIQEQFENTSDEFGQVTFIITPRTIDADENLTCTGQPIYVTITVEPAPVVIATPTEQTICDGATTDIQLTTPTTASHGVRFEYSISAQDPNITLLSTGEGVLEPGQRIQEQFENTSDEFGQVTFIITPRTIDAYENLTCTGQPIYVTITVEPAPVVIATPTEQTICDGGTTDIQLTTPTTASHGVRFEYSIFNQDANLNLLSGGTGLLEPGQGIQEQFENTSDQFGQVTFIITPRTIDADENLTCTGQPIYVTITVEPAPVVIATPTEQTICDGGTTDIILTTPTTASHGVRFEYSISAQDPNITLLSTGEGVLEPGQRIQEQFENTSDQFGQVTFIITPRTIDADENLTCTGQPIYVTITVEPTPKVIATPEEQTICDGGTTDIILTTPTTASHGVRFEYSISAQDPNITLLSTGEGVLEPGQRIQEQFENTSDQFGQVTFIITPRTIDADENLTCTGQPIYVTITVEPTPKVIATPEEQTICDGGTTDIVLTTPTTASHGVRFEYSISAQDPNITLLSTGEGVLEPGQRIQEQFENTSDEFGQVTFIITPRTIDAYENLTCTGQPIYVTITVEPAPKVIATPEEETICNDGTTDIELTTPTTVTTGVVTFDYTAVASHPAVTGFTDEATGLLDGARIEDTINNDTDQPQTVTYTITPRALGTGCADGQPITVVVTINPTPKVVATPEEETICNDGTTNIELTTPTTVTTGVVTFDYTAVASHPAVTGFTDEATGLLDGARIEDTINNDTDQPQTVTYTITPRALGTGCADGQPITVVVTINPTPKVVATPEEETICNDGTTNIELTTPTTVTTGVVTFDYTAVASHPAVTGFTDEATGLLDGARIEDTINNDTDQPQTVTYTITPRALGTGCADGQPITVVVTINPTPKVVATPEEEIICNDGTTDITLTTPSTVTTGVVTFDYTAVASHPAVTGFTDEATGLLDGARIEDTINNDTDQPQTVTYTITPRALGTGCADGQPITVVVTINPTPKVVATPEEETICNDGTTDITLTTPTTVTTGVVTFDYTAVASHPAVTGFTDEATGLLNGARIEDTINNDTDQPQTVTYTITPRALGTGCADGQPITVVVTINPTPKVVATPEEETICNDGTTEIELTTPTTVTTGVVTFDYTAVASHPAVTGFTDEATGLLDGARIEDTINNDTDQPQTVTYTIIPRTLGTGCADGQPITVVVTINPTPKVVATPEEETICNDGTTDIELTTPTTVTTGVVTFDYTAVASHPAVTGFTDEATGLLNGARIEDTINNDTDQPQTVTYTIIPRTLGTGCADGQPITVVVTINPTPKVVATPEEETICNDGTTDIELTTPTTVTTGVVTFDYTAVASHPAVTGFTDEATGLLNGARIEDTINNDTDQPQTVTYTITPRALGTGCADGQPITVVVAINPTPKVVATPEEETICNDGTTDIELTTPTTVTTGVVTFDYTAVASHPAVTGFTDEATGLLNGARIEDTINNDTDQPQTVTYTITPRALGTGCADGQPITVVVTINPTPKVVATPEEETICNDGTTDIELTTPTTVTTGVVTFDYTAVASHPAVTGFTDEATGLLDGARIEDTINNDTDQPQTVTYTITPRALGTGCADGQPITVVVTINPTPKVVATPEEETICNDGTTDIELTTPTTVTTGVVTFDLTATASGEPGQVTGFTAYAYNLEHGHKIEDQITNTTREVQYVTYRITPRALQTGCDDGETITVTVAVNPTPVLRATAEETIVCDLTTILITVDDLLGNVHGTKIYELTTTNAGGNVEGVLPSGEYPAGTNITDRLVNRSNEVQMVTYRLRALIKDPSGPGTGYCDSGTDTTITIFVNPTPVIEVSISETIYCDDSEITFVIRDLNGDVIGDKIYTLTTYYDQGQVTGVQPGGDYERIYLTNNLKNLSNRVQAIQYHFRARIRDQRGPGTGYFGEGSEFTFTIYLNPTPIVTTNLPNNRDTICTGTFMDILLYSPTTMIDKSGANSPITFAYQAQATGNPGDVTGFAPAASNLPQGTIITYNVRNATTIPQYITYTITPHAPATGCPPGIPTEVVIRVNPDPIVRYYISKEIECFGSYSGSLALETATGSGPYQIRWTGPDGFVSNEANLERIGFGRYWIEVTDANNCFSNGSIRLSNPDPIQLNYRATQVSCHGGSDASIEIPTLFDGGGPPYTFKWTGPENFVFEDNTTRNQNNLIAGQYTVVITDGKGCQYSSINFDPGRILLITEPEPLSVELEVTDATCNINNDGSIISRVEGGTAPYSYYWEGPDGEGIDNNGLPFAENLTGGIYTLRVTDSKGCVATIDAEIGTLPPFNIIPRILTNFNGFDVSCFGASDAIVELDIQGNFPPFAIQWSNGSTSERLENIPSGEYHVIVHDSANCPSEATVIVRQPERIEMDYMVDDVTCHGYNDGKIFMNVQGGAGRIYFNWDDGQATADAFGLKAGSHSVRISDANNCILDATILINEPEPLDIRPVTSDAYCDKIEDGSIELNVTGGTFPYRFSWSGGQTSENLYNVAGGAHIVTIEDFNFCTRTDTIIVNSTNELCMRIPNAFTPNNDGFNDYWVIGSRITGTIGEFYPWAVVEVYNRAGELVFRSRAGYPDPWDGTSKGRKLPMDSYFYVIFLNNGQAPVTGHVTIIR
jgi:gliding motility-associated-like protein